MTRLAAVLVSLVAGLLAGGTAHAFTPPRRVVSLNPCLDAILLEVADPSQITALSHYSRDAGTSAVAPIARRYPFTWGSAEEVVALQPDLVLSSGMGAAALSGVMPRLGVHEADFTVPASVEESLAQVQRVADLVGRHERGVALTARIRAAIAAAGPRPGEPRLGALVYEYRGLASGPDTLMSELMQRAGFDNLAPRYGLNHTGEVPLDQLLADPPQVLLAGRLAPGEPSWGDRVLSHPALKAVAPRVRRESFPEQLMFCGGPVIIPAMAVLNQAREDALKGISR